MKKLLIFFILALFSFSCTACSPTYVLKAGWQEAKILWRREDINKIIANPQTDQKTKEKFQLVLQAREFAKKIGLKPKKSFTQFSKIKDDETLWVLTAASKTSFTPVTWWFPIVGRIPYKGYFEKIEVEEDAQGLEEKGFDTYIRESAAFSTLGWFNDPLLSSTFKEDEVSLVDTVIHEILHNTIYIPNHSDFNESLANFIGTYGAYQFFLENYGSDHPFTKKAEGNTKRIIAFAKILNNFVEKLNLLYASYEVPLNQQENKEKKKDLFLELEEKRKEIIKQEIIAWNKDNPIKVTFKENKKINNASIIGDRIYFTQLDKFLALFSCSDRQLVKYVEVLLKMSENIKQNDIKPYEELQNQINKNCS